MPSHVLDSSGVLALLLGEPGADVVRPLIADAIISAVSSCEIETTLIEKGMSPEQAAAAIASLELAIADFTSGDASVAARLRPLTRHAGLSLGDRACLALAERLDLPVYTADRAWTRVAIGLKIHLIR